MFFKKPSVSQDMQDWIVSVYDWYEARFNAPPAPILPTKAFFSAPSGTSPETADAVLADVMRLLDVTHPITLNPLDVLPAEYRVDFTATSSIAGTFQSHDGVLEIRYDPALMTAPLLFINTMAHEVMHAKLEPYVSDLPGGEEMHELATDLGCIVAGFGVFQLQAADDAGWHGYLSQASRAYALAHFLKARDLTAESVTPHLSPRCKKLLRNAWAIG